MSSAEVVIACVSCRAYADRAVACTTTWGERLRTKHGIRTIVVVGDPQLAQPWQFDEDRGLLTLQVGDGYVDLVAKVQATFTWILQNTTATHVFKCDDDTYVNDATFVAEEWAAYQGVPMSLDSDPALQYASGPCKWWSTTISSRARSGKMLPWGGPCSEPGSG